MAQDTKIAVQVIMNSARAWVAIGQCGEEDVLSLLSQNADTREEIIQARKEIRRLRKTIRLITIDNDTYKARHQGTP